MSDSYPVYLSDGFVNRGSATTRLETFVDASFAFALSLLVVSGNDMPRSVDDLLEALKRVPAYAASFLLLIQFWSAHASWSRRFGLDDPTSNRLSLLLIFLLLVFVYPMHMVFASLFSVLSANTLPQTFVMNSLFAFRALFVTFGIAFCSMAWVMWTLNRHALKQAAALALDRRERALTELTIRRWRLVIIVALISIALAVGLPDAAGQTYWIGLPGFIYFAINISDLWHRRRWRAALALAR
jgi:uncharacterized membrane protein